MKLSVSNIAWQKEQDEEMYSNMLALGFTGLEIAPTRILKMPVYDKLQEAAEFSENINSRFDFTLSSMQSIWNGKQENMFGTQEEQETLRQYTKKAVAFAAACRCHNLVFGCPRNRVIRSVSQYPDAVSFFKEMGHYAEEHGTVIAMEANPAIYHTNFINETRQAAALVQDVAEPGFRLNLDFGAMVQNGENPESLKDYLHLINHVHISEPYLEPIKPRKEHQILMDMLCDCQYTGFVSVEMKSGDDLNEILSSMQYVKSIFKD